MSRFEEVVNDVIGEVVLGESGFRAEQLAQLIAESVRERQDARRAEVTIAARYPEHKPAPVSGIATQEIYTLYGSAVASERGTRRLVGVAAAGDDRVPVRAAAGRRALARAPHRRRLHRRRDRADLRGRSRRHAQPARPGHAAHRLPRGLRHGDRRRRRCCEIVENSMSSEIYELMKRSDEVAVVEKAHRRPRFVEDCVREMIRGVVEHFGELGERHLRLRAPGEPRDDPSAQRGGRALRPARRAAPRAELGRAHRASHLDARMAGRGRPLSRGITGARPGIQDACPPAALRSPSSPASPPWPHRPSRATARSSTSR